MEKPILFNQSERVTRPVCLQSLDDIQMCEQEDGFSLARACPAITNDEVALRGVLLRNENPHIFSGESRIDEAFGHRARSAGGRTDASHRVDLDELFVDLASESFMWGDGSPWRLRLGR